MPCLETKVKTSAARGVSDGHGFAQAPPVVRQTAFPWTLFPASRQPRQ